MISSASALLQFTLAGYLTLALTGVSPGETGSAPHRQMPQRTHVGPFIAMLLAASAFGQTEPAKRTQLSGTVSAVNAELRQLTLKSDKGEDVSVTTSETTLFLASPRARPIRKRASRPRFPRSHPAIAPW